jgi:hypothetical protein
MMVSGVTVRMPLQVAAPWNMSSTIFLYLSTKDAACGVRSGAFDLVSFKFLVIVHGNGDGTIISGNILQRGIQEDIANDQLSILCDLFEGYQYHIGLVIEAGGQVPHMVFKQFFYILIHLINFLSKVIKEARFCSS